MVWARFHVFNVGMLLNPWFDLFFPDPSLKVLHFEGLKMALTFAPSFENSKLSFKFILILLVLLAFSFACWFCFHLILLGFDCLFVYLPSFLFCLLAALILFWHFASSFFLFCSFYFACWLCHWFALLILSFLDLLLLCWLFICFVDL